MDEKKRQRRRSFISIFRSGDSDKSGDSSVLSSTDNTKRPSRASSIADSASVQDEGSGEKKKRRGLKTLFQPRHKKLPKPGESSKQMYMLERAASEAASSSHPDLIKSSEFESSASVKAFSRFKDKVLELGSSVTDLVQAGTEEQRRSKNFSEGTASAPVESRATQQSKFVSSGIQPITEAFASVTGYFVKSFKSNVRLNERDFLGNVQIGDVGLKITQSGTSSEILSQPVAEIKYDDVISMEDEHWTLIKVHGKDIELILSAFTVDYETAYYSILVKLNKWRARNEPVLYEEEEDDICECGVTHGGQIFLNAELPDIPPAALYNALFADPASPYLIWTDLSDYIALGFMDESACLVDAVFKEEIYGDLVLNRSVDAQSKILRSSPDHFVSYMKMQTKVKSYDCEVTLRIFTCCVRPTEGGPVQLNIFLDSQPTKYGAVDMMTRGVFRPVIKQWLSRAVERIVMAMPDGVAGEEEDVLEEAPTLRSAVSFTVIFMVYPWIREQAKLLAQRPIFKFKETILAVLLTLSLIRLIASFAYTRTTPCVEFKSPEEKYSEYLSDWQWQYRRIALRLEDRLKDAKSKFKFIKV